MILERGLESLTSVIRLGPNAWWRNVDGVVRAEAAADQRSEVRLETPRALFTRGIY